MTDILQMTFFGVIAGLIAGFFTRIIKPGMIFYNIGKRLNKIDNHHRIETARASLWVKFFRCMFCTAPWICLLLNIFYIIIFAPHWYFAIIGILGGNGVGNFVSEIIYSLRQGE